MAALDTLKAFFEASLKPSPVVFAIGFAFVLFFPVLLHILVTQKSTYTTLPSVLLVGPSGAGKTALLTLLERGPLSAPAGEKPSLTGPASPAPTHTSQAPAAVELAVSTDGTSSFRDDLDATGATAKRFLLIDTPGHAKLRRLALSHLSPAKPSTSPTSSYSATPKSRLKGLVFVLDAAALADGDALPATAAYLYDVLLALQKRASGAKGSKPPPAIPVLIAANKLDLFTALPAALVKSNLEAELGRIRKTRSRGLLDSGVGADDDVAGIEEGDDWLGEYGSDKFSFKQMLEFDIEVEVVGGSVLGDGPGADRWWKWIGQRA
ncbi:signal recognition particle receptor beta subunit-domain-containing protein [Lasiosphaeris hirsuta]|uniref:Signal recognition particle receptor subunit beta n=1 Tax=Lasiosphaeris hirsuta TaxID=260670 RepID=A0AA40AA01_9PEZI|nr:signal recognition particle receptor beta subunit-domain-containing protein [Lasiosphaeris hirsuta]